MKIKPNERNFRRENMQIEPSLAFKDFKKEIPIVFPNDLLKHASEIFIEFSHYSRGKLLLVHFQIRKKVPGLC